MSHSLNILLSNKIIILILILFQKLCLYNCQIFDNFTKVVLEEESQLIDVNDYNNLNLIVTTLKNIYIGIPPKLKSKTEAKLINTSSVITLNSNYLLAACLQDSLLTKINLNNGNFSSLLNYSDKETSSYNLDIPITSCSLSIYENIVFIGYSQIDYYENEINKTNIIIRLNITNKDSEDGPNINSNVSKKIFKFPKSSRKTDSSRQISCMPIKLKSNSNRFRLICLQEIFEYAVDYLINRYSLYAFSINENFNGFEEQSSSIFRTNTSSGFKLYKENSTYIKGLMKKYEFYLFFKDNKLEIGYGNPLEGNIDLFDANNGFIFFSSNTSFLNYNNIYYFTISKGNTKNHYKIFDYKEKNIKKILCYYEQSKDNIIFLYQTLNDIKFFTIYNSKKLYVIKTYKSKTLKVESNFERYYDVNEMLNVTNIGNLNVIKIDRLKNTNIYETQSFGYDFYEPIMIDNKIFINKSYNDWNDYHLSFIDHIEYNYTRIFYIADTDINLHLRTCYPKQCESCRLNYSICDDCKYENFSLIKDANETCYGIDKLIKGYIYNKETNLFEKCYSSCDFCSSISDDNSAHKCLSCANGYLPSYNILGNCYMNNDQSFITSSCSKYKVNSTGECVEQCPTSNFYYSFTYNEILKNYEKNYLNLPKYLFNGICYEACPKNTEADNINNICKCEFAFSINNNVITCYDDNKCITENSYQNQDTKECFSSLDKCLEKNKFFFNNDCYTEECPTNKISLYSQSEEVKNYFSNLTSLDNNVIDKLCICDIKKGVWINTNSLNETFYQECLSECPKNYEPESITHLCIKKGSFCPKNKCISSDDKELKDCISIEPGVKVYNNICFKDLDEIINNIKEISDNNEVISFDNGIIISVYNSKKSDYIEITPETKYSIVYLGQCEQLLKKYYYLSESTELYILGIDSPNKNKDFSTSVYNFEVYLGNGTKLDYLNVCKNETIKISSVIVDKESVNLENASYFSEFGYDIYDKQSSFYTSNCAPAYIDGNDITLNDRKKYYYPNDISLCNQSCHYIGVDYNNERFICECQLNYNFSEINNNANNIEEDISYCSYFLSFINYQIITCYDLFFHYKNYYHNMGFYISVGTLIFCLSCMVIFLILGLKQVKMLILDNVPNYVKIKDALKRQKTKIKYMMNFEIDNSKGNPIKKRRYSDFNIYNININKNIYPEYKGNISDEIKSKSNNSDSSKIYKNFKSEKNNIFIKSKRHKKEVIKDIYGLISYTIDEEVDKKDFNKIPYSQALRIDKRNYLEMFLSFLANEIDFVKIFYYKSPYSHLSIHLSLFLFESSLDFTLNCLLCNDVIISQKYHNNGNILFITSLTLSCISNIISSFLSFIIGKFANYEDTFEYILNDVLEQNKYFMTIKKFKKYLALKLILFFAIQTIINCFICYYMIIFFSVYQKIQKNIIINYLYGIIQSMLLSLIISIIISLIRYLSLKYRWKYIYYTSKHFFEKENIELLF